MSLKFVAVALAAALGQPLAMAQTTSKDVSKKTAEAVDTMKSYTVEKKNDAVAYGKKLMSAADRDIKKLERSAGKASDEAKAQARQEVKDLKAARAAAGEKLDQMGKASGEAWDGTKNAFADAYKDLKEGVEKTAKKLK
jgi:hypothetical protein